jgi:hypothetical protein
MKKLHKFETYLSLDLLVSERLSRDDLAFSFLVNLNT